MQLVMNILIYIAGISILLWLFIIGILDLMRRDNKRRKVAHNVVILLLSGSYIIKIVVMEIIPSFR